MPTTPTRSPAFAWRFSGEKVVMPAHISGPTSSPGIASGVLNVHALG